MSRSVDGVRASGTEDIVALAIGGLDDTNGRVASAYVSDDPQLADFARNELVDWLRSSAAATFKPPPGYAERIEGWIPSLRTDAQRHIKFILQTATST